MTGGKEGRRQAGGAAHCVCLDLKNGSGFQLQPQHTPAWLTAFEKKVPLLLQLKRNASCGSAAGDTVAAQ